MSHETASAKKKKNSKLRQMQLLTLVFFLLSAATLAFTSLHGFWSLWPVQIFFCFFYHSYFDAKARHLYGLCRGLFVILCVTVWFVFIVDAFVTLLLDSFILTPSTNTNTSTKTKATAVAVAVALHRYVWLTPYTHLVVFFLRPPHNLKTTSIPDTLEATSSSASVSTSTTTSSSALRSASPPLPYHLTPRGLYTHVFTDLPLLLLVFLFKLVRHPINKLITPVTPTVAIGALPLFEWEIETELVKEHRIVAVVNMCAEFGGRRNVYTRLGVPQLHLPTVDMSLPTPVSVERALDFLKTHVTRGPVFVHCKFGMGRSATIVLCHLIVNEKMQPGAAIQLLKQRRPEVTFEIVHSPVVQDIIARLAPHVADVQTH